MLVILALLKALIALVTLPFYVLMEVGIAIIESVQVWWSFVRKWVVDGQ